MPSHRLPDVIVVPVHNRRETTLDCLRRLQGDRVPDWAEILVVDDGSTDGTAEAIRREFPAVPILSGDGTWWWGGAIRRGMEQALAQGAERIFWLNDDCRPPAGALRALRDLVRTSGGVAWIEARAPGGWSYGGHRRSRWGMRRCTPEEEAAGKVESFSGNCVCLPRAWIERIGLPHDQLFPHGIADLDYGLRLHAAGAPLRALPGVVADNRDPAPSSSESWLASSRPMRAIWADFSSPRSFLHFPTWRRFSLRHWGPVWGWAVYAAPYARWAAIAVVRPLLSPARRARLRPSLNSPSGREKGRD